MATLSLRQLKSRIKSIENIKKVTKAMEMVAVSKLKASERDLGVARSYLTNVDRILQDLLASYTELSHPFFAENSDGRKVAIIVISSDTGLCGAYNNLLFKAVDSFLEERKKNGLEIIPIGRKGINYFRRRGVTSAYSVTDLKARYSHEVTRRLTDTIVNMFLSGSMGEVYAAYTSFETAARFKPRVERIFPVARGKGESSEYITEPSADMLFEKLVPLMVEYKMKSIFLSAFASEHSSRAISMGEATENAKDLLEQYILQRNKVRQAGITSEIIEVISSADALKG